MKHLIVLAGALAIGIAGPAIGKPGNGHGHGNGNNGGPPGCPPGLAKKGNGCMPPGQARKLGTGQRWIGGYGSSYSYERIPYDVRRRYRLSSRYRYFYQGDRIYVVDPRTMLIARVISALIR